MAWPRAGGSARQREEGESGASSIDHAFPFSEIAGCDGRRFCMQGFWFALAPLPTALSPRCMSTGKRSNYPWSQVRFARSSSRSSLQNTSTADLLASVRASATARPSLRPFSLAQALAPGSPSHRRLQAYARACATCRRHVRRAPLCLLAPSRPPSSLLPSPLLASLFFLSELRGELLRLVLEGLHVRLEGFDEVRNPYLIPI